MKKLLKFLLSTKFKTQKRSKKSGFTLIELLVGLIMAAFIITPLLGFVINVMTSDRQEQAKSSSEQEIQTALDYISRDVSQAVFIYDGYGVQTLVSNNALPTPTGVSTPVLVFWKREIKPKILPPNNDDAFAFSLVAYYLIKDTTCSGTSAWSCTARIGRVQMDGAVRDQDGNIVLPEGKAKPDDFTTPFDTATTTADPNAPAQTPEQRMYNLKTADFSNVKAETLIDYVDQTTLTGASPPPVTDCSKEPRSDRPDLTNPTDAEKATPYPYRQTPNDSSTVPASLKTGSFYACVSTDKTLAQVFIRGNSLARISPKNNPPEYSANKTAYFPKASIQVQGRGSIGQD